MNLVMLDTDTVGRDLPYSVLEEFGTLVQYPRSAPEEIPARVADADVLIVNKIKVNRALLDAAPHLKLVCVAATGYDNIDVDACREHGVAVSNVPGYSTDSVAQVTLAMVFSLATHLRTYEAYVNSGKYSTGKDANCLTPTYHDLSGQTWGILGYGNIGKQVGTVAQAMGCRLLVCRRHPTGDANEADLETLCRESDILTIHTPLNDTTRGMFGEHCIALLKPNVILVNVARGAVTDEAAIARAVADGRIGAFGCDVYAKEPFGTDHPFRALLGRDNVSLTPHMAWGSYESRIRCLNRIADAIRAFSNGERFNRVD